MYQEERDKKQIERYKKVVKYVVYEDMEKSKPKKTAVAAFKHKPYEIGGVQNELGEQSIERL